MPRAWSAGSMEMWALCYLEMFLGMKLPGVGPAGSESRRRHMNVVQGGWRWGWGSAPEERS